MGARQQGCVIALSSPIEDAQGQAKSEMYYIVNFDSTRFFSLIVGGQLMSSTGRRQLIRRLPQDLGLANG
jgi:hypothetical protein